jgi:hypothetical protein
MKGSPFAVAVAVCAFVAVGTSSAAKEAPECTRAKIISQDLTTADRGAYAMPVGNATVAIPLTTRTNRVVIETPKARMELIEAGDGAIILPVDGEAEFCADKDYLVVLDSKKKKHKFIVVGLKTLIKPEPPTKQ